MNYSNLIKELMPGTIFVVAVILITKIYRERSKLKMEKDQDLTKEDLRKYDFFETTKDLSFKEGLLFKKQTFIKKGTPFMIDSIKDNKYELHFPADKDNIYHNKFGTGYWYTHEEISKFAKVCDSEKHIHEEIISYKHSFANSYRQVKDKIPEENINKDKVKYFEDLLKKNDAIVIKSNIDYRLIAKSAKAEGQYQSTSYISYENKQFKNLADDEQYLNRHEMAKALSLGENKVIETHKLEKVLEAKINNVIQAENADNQFFGRIGYLGNDGKVAETILYTDKEKYTNEVKESVSIGRPIYFKKLTQDEFIKCKIIETYVTELPAIKYITEKAAKIIDNLNETKGHVHSIEEIKEMYNALGKKLEKFDIKDELEKFKDLSNVVDDIKQAQLKFQNDIAHENSLSQIVKDASIEMVQ